jgi:hypothetical protein
MRGYKKLFGVFLGLLVAIGLTMYAAADIAPDSLYAVLQPGESVTEFKTVTIPDIPPKADVVFSFDLTGSMAGIIDTAKAQAVNILNALDALTGVDIDYGVMSYMDYPAFYSSCEYSAIYGSGGDPCNDYAYSLDQPVTGNNTEVVSAITDLNLGCGGDGPQDYTRVFYESYADPNVGWRTGAAKVLVNFGDNVPHDCNLNEGVTSGTWTTGGDPGFDEVMGNSDDLDLQAVLDDMADEGVILLEAHTTDLNNTYWAYWTGITGGDVFLTGSTTLVDDIVAAVEDALQDPEVTGLHLEVDAACLLDITFDPAVDPGPLYSGNTSVFEVTITVPEGTEPGIYECTISAVDDVGVNYGDQTVQIVVYDPGEGFVTGGGWIDSPEGAYRADPSLTGKVNFGFVSKYKKGATVPTGQTEFQFHVADLNFHSSSYEWLIINEGGTNAQFKGEGTINGQNDPNMNPFKFMLWAKDEEPDIFRIKIWWDEGLVYDNGANQPISGGSIVIHTQK